MTPHFLKWSFGPKIESVDGICQQTDSRNRFSTLLLLLLLFLTFSVLVANPKKLLYTVANPARGLLNREKRTKEKVWQDRVLQPMFLGGVAAFRFFLKSGKTNEGLISSVKGWPAILSLLAVPPRVRQSSRTCWTDSRW